MCFQAKTLTGAAKKVEKCADSDGKKFIEKYDIFVDNIADSNVNKSP